MKINLDSNSIGDYKIGQKGYSIGLIYFRQREGLKFRTHCSFCEVFHLILLVFRQYGRVPECERGSHLCKSLSSGLSSKQLMVLFFSKEGVYHLLHDTFAAAFLCIKIHLLNPNFQRLLFIIAIGNEGQV
jgi:hypothetical protein